MIPLRAKLTLVYSILFLASVAAVEVATYWGVSAALDTLLENELIARRAVVEEYVQNHVRRLEWPALAAALANHRGFQPDWIGIESSEGHVLFAGAALRNARANPAITPSRVLREFRRIDGQDYVFFTGMDANIPAAILERIRWIMLFSAPLLLLSASAIGYWIAGRALKPVQQIANAAASIDSRNLATRLTVPASRDELQRLAETINHMLDRIETGFRQISQFTANASHELRTPVAIIRSTAEVALLHPGPADSPERNALRRILRQSERNSQLLEDMLHLARLDAAAAPNHQPVDLARSLRAAASSVLPLAQKQNITVNIVTPPNPVIVLADDAHLRRLWTILLDNAFKYTPAGGSVRIAVDMDHEVSIQDTGCGIAPEDLPHVFDRFYRADKSRGAGPAGFGLGLALARQITRSHKATIEITSRLSQGADVRIRFPKNNGIPHETAVSANSQVNHIALK